MILSRHASRRAQQRGVTHAQLSVVSAHGDMEVHRGGDCYAVWISRGTLRRLGPTTPARRRMRPLPIGTCLSDRHLSTLEVGMSDLGPGRVETFFVPQ